MKALHNVEVAVLLATFNGARFVEQQIRSLGENDCRFTLCWLDDQSTDETRVVVREAVRGSRVQLRECHQDERQGVPGAFFSLLECVEADIYLFCDQDDVWQPGKIDATVAALLPEYDRPALCCSDPLLFRNGTPDVLYRISEILRTDAGVAMRESRVFMTGFANGHTQGFTRPLRELYMKHRSIARRYAYMHDEWMHSIAVASGSARLLNSVPTTLYRWRKDTASSAFGTWGGRGVGRAVVTWQQRQRFRRLLARHAKGLLLAAPTLPRGPRLERLLSIAKLVAVLERRQSLFEVARLFARGVLWPNWHLAIGLATACFLSDVRPDGDSC